MNPYNFIIPQEPSHPRPAGGTSVKEPPAEGGAVPVSEKRPDGYARVILPWVTKQRKRRWLQAADGTPLVEWILDALDRAAEPRRPKCDGELTLPNGALSGGDTEPFCPARRRMF